MNNTDQLYTQTDFSHTDLSGHIFNHCTFIRCNFKQTNLRDSQFVNCTFREKGEIEGCDFSYCDLRDASFDNCRLAMSYFGRANGFGIEIRDSDLKGANLAQMNFVNRVSNKMYFCSAYITGCDLSYTNFERQLIEKCDLFENRWVGANLKGASFKGSDLSRGVFSKDCWEQFQIQDCDLTHSQLYGLDPRKVDLTGVKICSWQQEQLLEQLGIIVLPD
ncbi:Qnr family pentapeptide repeat protein [Celerinatantimonas diazotrophica]|uniref:Fluoroquinolone resistance protein n=1 Tax=Celerinatantimonas diazotrophica TaxID=412034 RepID=A0A4R1JLR9_9GAMM|nr:Qnr family pentapeptide repeat protein [Celerinatantimonas diazotrophica]TCK52015.1 fluoroquinolone resistance protein [Celerinatantimonas diazotrophica]CAG9296282.1 Pentapeptide repeat protein [Celerinatantimonas diazotrophica]